MKRSKYGPHAYASRAIDLVPYLSFPDSTKTSWTTRRCVTKHYEPKWDIYNHGEENGWLLFGQSEHDLPPSELAKLEELCFRIRAYALTQAERLFYHPPLDEELRLKLNKRYGL